MRRLTVVYDACVLYPASLRDLLLRLALTDLFHARWTYMIHEEWMRNVLKDRPHISLERLERTRALMDTNIRDGLISGFEYLIPTLVLPDPDDRHVLAAAICSGADRIVTANLGDFPSAILSSHRIEAQHPDEFVASVLELDAGKVCAAIKRQRESLHNPPKTADELLATFEHVGLTRFVSRLRKISDQI